MRNMEKMYCNGAANQQGSVFHIILLAIVLFAAISAVITQSGKGGEILSPEKAKIYAGEIIAHANQVSNAVRRVMLVNDCSETDISFHLDGVTLASYEHSPAQPPKCRIFHADGGGLTYLEPNAKWMQYQTHVRWIYSGGRCIKNVGSNATCGANEKELQLNLYGLKKEVCEKINAILLNSNEIPAEAMSSNSFNGTYTTNSLQIGASDIINGKKSFCMQDTDGTTPDYYTFVHALIVR